MLGNVVRCLVGALLVSVFVAGKPDGVVLDQGEQPAHMAEGLQDPAVSGSAALPELPEALLHGVGSPGLPEVLPGVGPVQGPAAKSPVAPGLGQMPLELETTEGPPPAGNEVEWQTGSPEHVTTEALETDMTTSQEDPDVMVRFLQQKKKEKGRRDIERRGTGSTVSEADKKIIVDMHNTFRENVIPTARLMVKMYWDDDLAASAQAIADECRTVAHDDADERRTKSKIAVDVGQNYAKGPNDTNWSNVVNAWYAEIKDFKYGMSADSPVGHYTQEVRGPSSHVGCGSKECPNLAEDGKPKRSFYCNYAHMNMDYTNPYELGDPCAACPGRCVNGLCDCGPMLCQHGAVSDYVNCKCKCRFGFSGESCTNCPLIDFSPNCGTSWNKAMCSKYTNVRDECPCMCGDCDDKCSKGDIRSCKNGGILTESAAGDGKCTCKCPNGCKGDKCQCQTAWQVVDDNPGCAGVGMDYCAYGNIRDVMCKFKCNC